jgi:hypothetical protein
MRFRSTLFALLVATGTALLPATVAARNQYAPDTPPPPTLTCPADTVVWVNTRSGVYHMPGMTWFGHTRQGEYMCRKAADQAGYRATKNGQ